MRPRSRRHRPSTRTAAGMVLGAPESTLLDVIDNVLNRGVVLTGDVMLGIANVDLIYLRMAALLCAADRIFPGADTRTPPPQAKRGQPPPPRPRPRW